MSYNPFFEDDFDVLLDEEVVDHTGTGDYAQLIVYNDEINTFDWVIKSFMEVLNHTFEQSEQLSLIIHTKGKATVKTAPSGELRPKKAALQNRGLSAVIEERD
jgi:ATP-dependent Clp protease adaptor protein ClpS